MNKPYKPTGNKAIDHEFKHYPETSSGFHQECVDHIKQIRTIFLLLSLLRVLHGVKGSEQGQLTWARQIPDPLAYICHDYPLTTTARLFALDEFDGPYRTICGDCFTVWIGNIRKDWDACVERLHVHLEFPPPFLLCQWMHAVDCLLKYDP